MLAVNEVGMYASYASKLYTLFVVFMIPLNVYKTPLFPVLGLGEFVLVCLLPYFLINCNNLQLISSKYKWVLIFCFYSLIVSVSAVFLINGAVRGVFVRFLREGFYYTIIFLLGSHLFNFKLFKSVIEWLVMLLAGVVVFQTLVYYTTGLYIPGYLLNAQLNDSTLTGLDMYTEVLRSASYHGYIKPSGFLCEAAHCAHCFFIFLLLLLFSDFATVKHPMLKSMFISVAMLATMSTSAFIELFLAWSTWVFFVKTKSGYKVLAISVFALICICFISTYLTSEGFFRVIERFAVFFTGDFSISSSTYLRLGRGYDIYSSLPFFNKIFGIGFGAYEAAVKTGVIKNSFIFDLTSSYMNSFSYIIVSSGIVGLILYLCYFVSAFRRISIVGKILVVAVLVMFFGTSLYCTPFYVWMMLVINFLNESTQ